MHHLHFNHLAILVAASIQFVLGAVWYSLFFAKPWMALTGHTPGQRPEGAVVAMISSLVSSLILPFVLAHVVLWSGANTVGWGLIVGFHASDGFGERSPERPEQSMLILLSFWLTAIFFVGANK